MRSAPIERWLSIGVGLALAVAVAVSPAHAQNANLAGTLTLPGRTSGGGAGFNPLLLILPAIAVALFIGERAHATPTSTEGVEPPAAGTGIVESTTSPRPGTHRLPGRRAGASSGQPILSSTRFTPGPKRIARLRTPATVQPVTNSSTPGPPSTTLPPSPVLAGNALPPPPGETRFRPGEVLVAIAPATPPATVARILRSHRLTEAEVASISLLGTSIRLWRFPDGRSVASVVRELAGEASLTRIQPNYVYELQQEPSAAAAPVTSAPAPPQQYSLAKLHVDAGDDMVVSDPIRIAVIDTAIDETHPDLAGAVEERFDAIGGAGPPRSLDHGTAMAGAIAARGRVKGVAPSVHILSARAFDSEGGKSLGSTLSILKGIDWAATERARVVNMSFAGPLDPTLHDILAAAFGKGMILVGAAGNAGPQSPPLYPGADEKVLAVTATDADDKLYARANVGPYVAVAAPGVDVLLPTPRGGYAFETGTSVSAALVSGVAALLLERRPATTPAELKRLLMTTATPLGTGAQAATFGAGLVDARRAIMAAAAPKTN
jgi:subtilisin family serine protease